MKKRKMLMLVIVVTITSSVFCQERPIDTINLDSVTVIGLGMKRSERISSTSINQKDINPTANPLYDLNIPGVQLQYANSTQGTPLIQIRGPQTLEGSNQPLITLGGKTISVGGFQNDLQMLGGEGYDLGLGLPISSEDLSQVSILKNTPLYGGAASKGVLNYEPTKVENGFHVTYSFTGTMTDPYLFKPQQNRYGGAYGIDTAFGSDGGYDLYIDPVYDHSWNSTPFDPSIKIKDTYGNTVPYQYPKNDYTSYFKNGYGAKHYFGISKGNDTWGVKFSYTRNDNSLITPNSKISNDILFGQTRVKVGKLEIKALGSFSNGYGSGRPGSGYSLTNPTSLMTQYGQTQIDYATLRNYSDEQGNQLGWNYLGYGNPVTAFEDNPYWAAYKNAPTDQQKKWFASGNAEYKAADWLSFELSGSTTGSNVGLYTHRAIGSVELPFYMLQKQNRIYNNLQFLSKFKKEKGNYSFNGFLGASLDQSSLQTSIQSTQGGLINVNDYSLTNSVDEIYTKERTDSKTIKSLLGGGNIGYKRKFYVDVMARLDQSSKLPKQNNTYPYYGIGGAYIFSEDIKKSSILSFGKLRTNYSVTGIDPALGLFQPRYERLPNFLGVPTMQMTNALVSPNLKPEIASTWESGIDMDFFYRRIRASVTYFITQSKDHIVNLNTDPASGYITMLQNVGPMTSKGWELGLTVVPVKTSKILWEVTGNWSKYKSEIIGFAEGIDQHFIGYDPLGTAIGYQKGMSGPQIFGRTIERIDGKAIVDQDGYYQVSELKPLGSTQPDWIGNISSMFSYKKIYLKVTITHMQGGIRKDNTGMLQDYNGLSPRTAESGTRENGIVADGVTLNPTTQIYEANTTNISAQEYWGQSLMIDEWNIIKATSTRISYLSLGTTYKKVSVELFGTNLLVWNLDRKGVDPNEGIISNSTFQGILQGPLPSSRTLGIKITTKF